MGARVESTTARRGLPEPDINVTPLVDVVLVLLIIFMVIAPELEHGERVELPAVAMPDEKSKSKLDPITVTVTSRGTVYLEKEAMADLNALESRLSALRNENPDRRVMVKGDSAMPYGKMRDAFVLCQRVGFTGVSLSVSQKGGAKSGQGG